MERIDSLDTLKGLALLAVVVIHIRGSFLTTQGLENGFFDLILFSVSRFGVPIFFLISGFLLKKKFEEKGEDRYTRKYVKKLVFYYILATGLYIVLQTALLVIEANTGIKLPRDISMETAFIEGVFDLFYTGTVVRGSLWFFPALAISAALIYGSEKLGRFDMLLALSVILHITGILSNTYQILDIPLPVRDALFFGLVFTAVGFKIGQIDKEKLSDHSKKLLLASGLFIVLNIVENIILMEATGTSFIFQDYSFFTLPLAVSIFLLGLGNPGLGSSTRINLYGKYTLLGYVFHQVAGGLLTGLSILTGSLAGLKLSQSSSWNLVLVLLTYIVTMEAVVYYRERLDK